MHLLRSLEQVLVRRTLDDAPTVQEIQLSELAKEVFRQLEDMARARQVVLRAGDSLPTVHTDTASLELALINLVSNAIKYSDAAKAQRFVEIDARTTDRGFELRVVDNGLGIPPDMVDKVFQRFVRAHAHLDSERGTQGSGLGLAIVEECLAAVNGSIRVESNEGRGTTFYLDIPTAIPPA
jgi:signal transduction histidine kinase